MERVTASDAELVDASRRGERGAFGELVERCATMVGAVSYAATRDRVLSEDVTQDTFVAAWRDLGRLRDATAVRPWLCGIARNLGRKARRQRGWEAEELDTDAVASDRTPFDAIRESEAEHVVRAALERMPDIYREALVLFYYEQRSAKEVAAALGIGEDVVHQRLSRGRRYLATNVEHIVERALEGRRSRRDVAASVLAALPLALAVAPSRADAATTKGSSMWKIGALAVAATTTVAVGTVIAWPRARTSSPPAIANAIPAPATAHRHGAAPLPPMLPAWMVDDRPADPSTTIATATAGDCTTAVRHMMDLAAASLPGAPDLADRMSRDKLEQLCREQRWTPEVSRCVLAADDIWNAQLCMHEASTSPPELAPPGVDASCAATAEHLLAITSDRLMTPGDANNPDMAAMRSNERDALVTRCTRDAWSEQRRRCSVAAQGPLAIPGCVQLDAKLPPPAPPGTDASCIAVGHHVGALVTTALGELDVPGELRDELAASLTDLAPQIETACTNGAWSEALRRCLVSTTDPIQLDVCHGQAR
jgi:RNA polymerase sigma factor (sigma-70 family)